MTVERGQPKKLTTGSLLQKLYFVEQIFHCLFSKFSLLFASILLLQLLNIFIQLDQNDLPSQQICPISMCFADESLNSGWSAFVILLCVRIYSEKIFLNFYFCKVICFLINFSIDYESYYLDQNPLLWFLTMLLFSNIY